MSVPKYYRCCIRECGSYEELTVLDVDTTRKIFVCFEHLMKGHDICQKLRNGSKPQNLNINTYDIITRGQEHSTTPALQEPPSHWRWIEDYNQWMDIKGNVVKISSLEEVELEDTIVAIQEVNIKRITERIEWVRELKEIKSSPKLKYPEDILKVKQEEAYAKLEEFYEVMVEKDLLVSD